MLKEITLRENSSNICDKWKGASPFNVNFQTIDAVTSIEQT